MSFFAILSEPTAKSKCFTDGHIGCRTTECANFITICLSFHINLTPILFYFVDFFLFVMDKLPPPKKNNNNNYYKNKTTKQKQNITTTNKQTKNMF